MLHNHFMMSGTSPQPDYMISYTAEYKVPFIGGDQKRNLTMWETDDDSEPMVTFEIVKDVFSNGYGEWHIKTSDPSCFYGLIRDINGYEYSMDSGNFHAITGLIFPDYDYNYNDIISIGGPLLGGGEGNSLTDVTLPFRLEYLGLDTFKGSANLQTILIPPRVKSIGNNCFKGCNSLTAFCCDALTPPVLNGCDIFENFNTIPNLKIYVGFVEDYLLNEDWSKYADIIYLDPCIISYKATDRPNFISEGVTPSSLIYQDYNNGRGIMRFTSDVTTINGKLFYDNSTNLISNVYLPNTITSIGDEAFRYCSSLTSITIPNSVTNIGDYAFLGCSSLPSITIPNSVTSIGNNAFSSCSSLTAVTIPNSLTNIGEGAFSGCSSLTFITIPKNVTSIGQNAFYGCYSLTSVVWNAKNCSNFLYSSSGLAPFYNIQTKITSFVFGDEVEYIPARLCYGMSKLTSTTIGDSVTSIGERAFINCSSLTSITIGNNVSSIGENAFYGCSRLTSVTLNSSAIVGNTYTSNSSLKHMFGSQVAEYIIGDTATSIGRYAFYDCSSLTSITIPNSVTNIGEGAFSGCSSLPSITIPNSVTSIGGSVFYDCSSLTSMVVESGNTIYDSRENCNAIIETATNSLIVGCQNTIIPNSVTSIGKWAFVKCTSLTSITIPDSVTSIGDEAFRYCSSLTSVTIGNNVSSIGNNAFRNCTSLASMVIGNGITKIGNNVFGACKLLASVVWNAKNCADISRNYPLFEESIKSFTFGDNVERIPARLLYYETKLTSIVIPNSVTSIGENAFTGCASLNSVIVDNGNSIYDSRDNCNAIIETATNTLIAGCTNTTIPNSVTSIGDYAFENTNITTGVIPEGVVTIGLDIFKSCSKLTSITIPSSVETIKGRLSYNNPALKTVIWNAEDVHYTGEIFSAINTNITTFIFGSSVRYIPSGVLFTHLPTSIIFNGTMELWNSITKEDGWLHNATVKVVLCTDGDVTL